MNPAIAITQKQLPEFLLHVAPSRPVFILGQPGIGKTSLVRQFADLVGLPCVALLGTQLAPEDLIGVPEIKDGTSRFCPRTFGVVLDTSGSMDRSLLAKALGAIAGYAALHEVPAVRLVFCDAAAPGQYAD